jgi:hypothetical protein
MLLEKLKASILRCRSSASPVVDPTSKLSFKKIIEKLIKDKLELEKRAHDDKERTIKDEQKLRVLENAAREMAEDAQKIQEMNPQLVRQ